MIRLISRRLIIPRGDTGNFSIPLLSEYEGGTVAIFALYDTLTHETVLTKTTSITSNILSFDFVHEDTLKLEPKKYLWDIIIYTNPIYDDENKIIGGQSIDSYYAAYKLPICEIREVVYSAE